MIPVEVFKTNVKAKSQAIILVSILKENFPLLKVNFALDDPDKILRVEGQDICIKTITGMINENGYKCEVLK